MFKVENPLYRVSIEANQSPSAVVGYYSCRSMAGRVQSFIKDYLEKDLPAPVVIETIKYEEARGECLNDATNLNQQEMKRIVVWASQIPQVKRSDDETAYDYCMVIKTNPDGEVIGCYADNAMHDAIKFIGLFGRSKWVAQESSIEGSPTFVVTKVGLKECQRLVEFFDR
jgi:hypothetical protein